MSERRDRHAPSHVTVCSGLSHRHERHTRLWACDVVTVGCVGSRLVSVLVPMPHVLCARGGAGRGYLFALCGQKAALRHTPVVTPDTPSRVLQSRPRSAQPALRVECQKWPVIRSIINDKTQLASSGTWTANKKPSASLTTTYGVRSPNFKRPRSKSIVISDVGLATPFKSFWVQESTIGSAAATPTTENANAKTAARNMGFLQTFVELEKLA